MYVILSLSCLLSSKGSERSGALAPAWTGVTEVLGFLLSRGVAQCSCVEIESTALGFHPSPATVGLGKLLTCIELEFPQVELEMLIVMSFHNT